MSQSRDSDDFLGWAPDLGFWDVPDAPPEARTITPAQPPAVFAPTPPPARQPAPRRPGSAGNPPKPPVTRPQAQPTTRQPASRLRFPVLVAAAVMLVITFFTALVMATSGPDSSPVMLGVFGVMTVLLGRVAWGLRHR